MGCCEAGADGFWPLSPCGPRDVLQSNPGRSGIGVLNLSRVSCLCDHGRETAASGPGFPLVGLLKS